MEKIEKMSMGEAINSIRDWAHGETVKHSYDMEAIATFNVVNRLFENVHGYIPGSCRKIFGDFMDMNTKNMEWHRYVSTVRISKNGFASVTISAIESNDEDGDLLFTLNYDFGYRKDANKCLAVFDGWVTDTHVAVGNVVIDM